MDWLEWLRGLGGDQLFVAHEPLTPRYERAGLRLPYLLRTATLLGERDGETDGSIEIATWSPPPTGRGPGLYACFRIFRRQSLCVLFCFYDGTEKSPAIKSISGARAYARSHHFQEP